MLSIYRKTISLRWMILIFAFSSCTHWFTHPQVSYAEQVETSSISTRVGLALDVIGFAMNLYQALKVDDLSSESKKKISEVLSNKTKRGFIPLLSLDAQTRSSLGSQGRIELGIQNIHNHIETVAGQLMAGQHILSEKLSQAIRDSQEGHRITQEKLDHIMRAEFRVGVKSLNDGLKLLHKDPKSPTGNSALAQARVSLTRHAGFLEEEESAGREIPVEHWAIIRLTTASCYLALGLKKESLAELEELMALPNLYDGITRLIPKLSVEEKALTMKYFDQRTEGLDRRVLGLRHIISRHKQMKLVLEDERTRLNTLKEQAEILARSDHELSKSWGALVNRASKKMVSLEDERALKTLDLISAEYSISVMVPKQHREVGDQFVLELNAPSSGFKLGVKVDIQAIDELGIVSEMNLRFEAMNSTTRALLDYQGVNKDFSISSSCLDSDSCNVPKGSTLVYATLEAIWWGMKENDLSSFYTFERSMEYGRLPQHARSKISKRYQSLYTLLKKKRATSSSNHEDSRPLPSRIVKIDDTKCIRFVSTSGHVLSELKTGYVRKVTISHGTPDPECETGVLRGGICCDAACGMCGGRGCSHRSGGRGNCCQQSIRKSERLCSNGPPPCIMDPHE